jgi:hypothetical protein
MVCCQAKCIRRPERGCVGGGRAARGIVATKQAEEIRIANVRNERNVIGGRRRWKHKNGCQQWAEQKGNEERLKSGLSPRERNEIAAPHDWLRVLLIPVFTATPALSPLRSRVVRACVFPAATPGLGQLIITNDPHETSIHEPLQSTVLYSTDCCFIVFAYCFLPFSVWGTIIGCCLAAVLIILNPLVRRLFLRRR